MTRKRREMSERETEIIIRMRGIGFGCEKIGKELGLSHQTIRNYCKREGIK